MNRKNFVRRELGWAMHNLVGHPISGLIAVLAAPLAVAGLKHPYRRLMRLSRWIHDSTVP